ncbi:MAG: ammonia-forming cytochrome c nitrite reductase subunit c552 [Propionibacteriaceae bacterium]|jgi:nitrite reductase (cytochrome c-552)|nr:ammonia-forming cytochrome c nitrite reductase subunit c552 [Propionibacteriaceae bacterium]
MTDQNEAKTRKSVPIWALAVIAIAAAAIGFLLAALIANMGEKKGESATQYTQVVEMNDTNQYDPSAWGQNFPSEFEGWKATAIYKSSDHKPDTLVANVDLVTAGTPINPDFDTRTEVAGSKIEEDTRVKRLWQGFAFFIDYRHARGHAYMLEDQLTTKRVTERNQPGACIHCHASTVQMWAAASTAGPNASFNETMNSGFVALNSIPYDCEATSVTPEWQAAQKEGKDCTDIEADMESMIKKHSMDQVNGDPIGCVDCHDPATMKLRISRPGLINSFAEYKAGQGIANYDVNKDATNNELRALVCAQCHIEYYFAGANKDVVFPWAKGLDIDDTLEYYNEPRFTFNGVENVGFSDYANPRAQVGSIKAQHPEYEVWSSSIHAANGVTCADCHMAYTRDGSQKITNHDIRNPLYDVNATCGQCHTASEQVLRDRVTTINNRFKITRDAALDSAMVLLDMLEAVQAEDSTIQVPEATMAKVKELYRKGGYYADYAYSENSYGFHNPDYLQRVLGQSLDATRQGQLLLSQLGVEVPDLGPSEFTAKNTAHIEEVGLK